MRLGVVGMMAGDPRAITGEQLQQVAALGVSAACFHVPGAVLPALTVAPIGHIKDLATADGFVVHLNEAAPGEGCLDLHTAVRRWETLAPDRYLLVEHLPDERIPAAVANVQRIAAEAGVAIR